MPTYEYACPACGARFETWQKMTDDPLTTCPTCGGAIHRVLFPAGIVFKGGGFYSTDHRHAGGTADETTGDAKTGDTKTPAASTATGTEGSSATKDAGGSAGSNGSGGSGGAATSGASKPAAAPTKD